MSSPTIGIGTSLWLVPEEPSRAHLASAIDRLSTRLGTPSFPPHVTLLSGIEAREADVLSATAALARTLAPLSIRLDGVFGADAHFRCLYVRAEPTDALLVAHADAARRFGRRPDPAFLPHLSLAYGSLDPEVKAALARELGQASSLSFDVRRLDVWRTVGEVAAWAPIGAFDLGAPLP